MVVVTVATLQALHNLWTTLQSLEILNMLLLLQKGRLRYEASQMHLNIYLVRLELMAMFSFNWPLGTALRSCLCIDATEGTDSYASLGGRCQENIRRAGKMYVPSSSTLLNHILVSLNSNADFWSLFQGAYWSVSRIWFWLPCGICWFSSSIKLGYAQLCCLDQGLQLANVEQRSY
jgi:hypothetical protein